MALLVSVFGAQSADPPAQIRVTGRAVVSVEPERAEVQVGVVTEAAEAEEAARQNAEKLDRALEALRQELGDEAGARFETVGYSLQPVYRRPEPGEMPVPSGYRASNVLRVHELPLDAVGKVIDVATAGGANTIRGVHFDVRDESEAKSHALQMAAREARSKAESLAEALGVRIVRILEVSEGEADVVRPMPMYRGEMAMAQSAPTPVEPGEIEIRASVTLAVEIAPR